MLTQMLPWHKFISRGCHGNSNVILGYRAYIYTITHLSCSRQNSRKAAVGMYAKVTYTAKQGGGL